MCGIMYRDTSTHIEENERCAHAKKQLLSPSHAHKHARIHFLLVNGIKHLGDNSPDGQTRNQASISLPASSSPYPFNHSISLAHAHTHLPHTWNYNYIFLFPTAAKQLPRWQFPWPINQTRGSLLIVKHNKNPLKVCELRPGIADKSGAKHSPRRGPWPCQLFFLCSSPPPGPLLPNRMTDVYHLFPHALRWG